MQIFTCKLGSFALKADLKTLLGLRTALPNCGSICMWPQMGWLDTNCQLTCKRWQQTGSFPVVQSLKLHTSNAGSLASIHGQGTEIWHAGWQGQNKRKKKKKNQRWCFLGSSDLYFWTLRVCFWNRRVEPMRTPVRIRRISGLISRNQVTVTDDDGVRCCCFEHPENRAGLPWWLSGKKNPPASAGIVSLIPGLERSPGEGYGNPLQYACLQNPMDRGALRATVHGVAESWTRLSD